MELGLGLDSELKLGNIGLVSDKKDLMVDPSKDCYTDLLVYDHIIH